MVYRSVTNPTPLPMNVVCRDISTWTEYWRGTLAPYETQSFDLVTAPASTGAKSYRFEAASTDTPSAFEVVRSPIATLNVAASNSSITLTKEVSLSASGPWGPSVAINSNGTKVYFRITANFNANSNSPVYKGSQYRIWDYLPAELTYDTSSFTVVSNTGCVIATTASTRILQAHDVECTVGSFTVTPANYAANTGITQTAVIRFSATFSTSAGSAYVVNYAHVDSAVVPGQAAVIFNGATPYPDGALVTWTDEPGGGNFSGSIGEVPSGTPVPLFASANVGYRFKGFFLTDQVNVRNVGAPQLVNGAYGYKTLMPFTESGEIGTLLLDVDKIVLVDFDKIRYAFYWNKTSAPGQADAIVDVSSPGSASTYDAVNISAVASALAGADTAALEATLAEGGATSSQKVTSSRATTTTYFGYGTKPSAIANLGLGGADHEGNWVLYTQTSTTTTTSWSSANQILVIDVDTHELVGTLDSTSAADIESALPNAGSANSNQFTVNGQTGFAAGYFFTTRVATSSTSTSSSSAWSPVIIDFGDKPDLLAGPDAWKKGRVLPPLIDAMRLFNLDATYPKFWEWVGPKSGILVWNPTGDELLQPTGADLFGNVTWFGNWNDGYEPLALLDANKDGHLSGGELDGLSIWLDANTDAIVQPGEMRKAADSIVSISVHPRRSGDGNAEVQDGVTTRDNKTHNTRDWWSAGGIDRNAMSRYRADLEAPCIYDWLPTEFNKSEQGGYLRFWLSEKGNLCVASAPRQDVINGKVLLKVFTGSLDGKYVTWWSDALKTTAAISEDGSHLSGVTVDLMTGKQSEWTANRKSGGLLSALMVAN